MLQITCLMFRLHFVKKPKKTRRNPKKSQRNPKISQRNPKIFSLEGGRLPSDHIIPRGGQREIQNKSQRNPKISPRNTKKTQRIIQTTKSKNIFSGGWKITVGSHYSPRRTERDNFLDHIHHQHIPDVIDTTLMIKWSHLSSEHWRKNSFLESWYCFKIWEPAIKQHAACFCEANIFGHHFLSTLLCYISWCYLGREKYRWSSQKMVGQLTTTFYEKADSFGW